MNRVIQTRVAEMDSKGMLRRCLRDEVVLVHPLVIVDKKQGEPPADSKEDMNSPYRVTMDCRPVNGLLPPPVPQLSQS